MNRTSTFGRMAAWILLAVCFLPVALRAEVETPSAVASPVAAMTEMTAGAVTGHRLTGVEAVTGTDEVRVFLETDGSVTARPFVLDSPDRLVVDLEGVRSALKVNRYNVDSPIVSVVRVGQRMDGGAPVARVVLDLKQAQPYRIDKAPGGLMVIVGGAQAATGAIPAGVHTMPAGQEDDVIFRATQEGDLPQDDAPMRAMNSASGVNVVPVASGSPSASADSDMVPTPVPADENRVAAVTTNSEQPVGSGSAAPAPATMPAGQMAPQASVGSTSKTMPPSTTTRPSPANPAASDAGKPVMVAQAMATAMPSPAMKGAKGAPAADGATFTAKTITPENRVYTGKKISLNLVDADIKQVFRLFHEISGLNFVLDPGVSGNVTIVLDEVPWDQALDIILKNNSLDKVYEDNVIRIATTSKLASEASGRKALKEAKELEVEPVTITRRLSYAKAKDLDQIIKTGVLLSQRGKSFFDDRTNTLIITDVPTKIEPVDRLITDLDAKTPQVLIEARIVLTGRDYIQDLGIDWGFTFDRNLPNHFFDDHNNFPNHGDVSYGLHLPRAAAASKLAFNLFNRSGTFNLQVALDALEIDGRSRTLSAPKIATQNNVKAEIEQGIQIPIANSTATEINVEFVSASLKLAVTPQITAEGTVIMDVLVENNQPSKTVVVGDIPGIDTQRAQTKVMVEDGGTTVIGGIFSVNEGRSEAGVPWFKNIPGLGWLFKSRNITIQNRELLIFITPKILKAN